MEIYEILSLVVQVFIAIGTIGAVVVALNLASKPISPNLEITHVGESYAFDNQTDFDKGPDDIDIHLTNKGPAPVRIEAIFFRWSKKSFRVNADFLNFDKESTPKKETGSGRDPFILCELACLQARDFSFPLEQVLQALELSYYWTHVTEKEGLKKILPRRWQKWIETKFEISPYLTIDVLGGQSIDHSMDDFLLEPFTEYLREHRKLPSKVVQKFLKKMRPIKPKKKKVQKEK